MYSTNYKLNAYKYTIIKYNFKYYTAIQDFHIFIIDFLNYNITF